MKKAELEAHHDAYTRLMSQARAAQNQGDYRTAIKCALSSWDNIDGMMQYERKYGDDNIRTVEAIDIVLKYAPLLMDFRTIDELESLLADRRRIEKSTSDSMAEKLSSARSLMWDAHKLWDYLEFHPDTRLDGLTGSLGGKQDRWRSLIATWEKMGLLNRIAEGKSYRLSLCTRMGKLVPAKCPSCGGVTEAPKAMFLEDTKCPMCRKRGMFVFLATKDTAQSRG